MGKQSTLSTPSYESLAPLLQTNSERNLTRICQLALSVTEVTERVAQTAVDECAKLLTVDSAQAQAILESVQVLAQQSKSTGGGTNVSADLFPDKFPKNAATTIASIINRVVRENDARQTPNFVPQLESLDWRIDVKAASSSCSKMSVPTCLLQIQVRDDAGPDQESSLVNVEVTKEAMTTLLDGLGKIRDQLSGIAN